MKILFLEIETERSWAIASTGPGVIGSYLRKYGHEADMIRVLQDHDEQALVDAVKKQKPDIIGFSLCTRQWSRALHIAKHIRNKIDLPIIAGGIHPTFAADIVLESGAFDYLCIGEGEEAALEVLNSLEDENKISDGAISNIQIKAGAPPKLRRPVAPIDDLPFIARDLIDEKYGVIHITTQRGCPYPCTYCAAGAIDDLYENTEYFRRRSVGNVIDELREISKRCQLNYVVFLDDTFTINKKWVNEFCRIYGKEIGVGFSINARAETVSRDLITQLAEAGCRHIIYGVESGSERVRREILNRRIDNLRFIEVFNWTKESKILATANYMLGMPGETAEDIEQTFLLHKRIEPDDIGYFVFYPYPGTGLFDVCKANGYLPDNYLDFAANNRQSILNLQDITKGDIECYYNRFTELRKQAYMSKYGGHFQGDDKDSVNESFDESAALG